MDTTDFVDSSEDSQTSCAFLQFCRAVSLSGVDLIPSLSQNFLCTPTQMLILVAYEAIAPAMLTDSLSYGLT